MFARIFSSRVRNLENALRDAILILDIKNRKDPDHVTEACIDRLIGTLDDDITHYGEATK